MTKFPIGLVRLVLLALVLVSGASVLAQVPPAPANHVYDPDFLLSPKLTEKMVTQLARFETDDHMTIYVALLTSPPRIIEEMAQELNEAWNQSGYGVTIVFSPPRRELQVLPSPELSLVKSAAELGNVFRAAARAPLERGDYSGATSAGTLAVVQELREMKARLAVPASSRWSAWRRWVVLGLVSVVLGGIAFLWLAVRVWRSANLFDHSYHFPPPDGPPALRFGASRCGGRMATIDFRARSERR